MPNSGYTHGDTPQKAMVRGALSYMRATGLAMNKTAVFRHFGLSRAQGYSAITAATTRAQEPDWVESRGRPAKISKAVLRFLEYLLWNDLGTELDETLLERAWREASQDSGIMTTEEGGEDERTTAARAFVNIDGPTWESMMRQGRAFGLQATYNARTMRRAMGTLLYRRCLRCEDTWVNPRHKAARLEYAKAKLEALPDAEDWKRVRFSGELHFGFGLDGRMRLLPRPGEKYACPSCQMQTEEQQQKEHSPSDWDRDIRRVHAWAAVGQGYRSELVFYDEQTGAKSLGLMTPAAYRDVVLEQHVQSWPVGETTADEAEAEEVLVAWEEDYDPHAAGGNAIDKAAEAWKDARRLRRHRGCADAPDLCPLDVVFPPGKMWTVKMPLTDWEPATLQRAAREAWAAVDQGRVNLWVELMPQRLGKVVEEVGAMVPW
ncbi:hypothetical protein LMH87_010181 [Akanthomyces muscarius]|uniref:HMG box protein n=1 Tax=Akanthomyces muscarius TaxID=2231603 RepID=A0A9W8QDG9_AKAMU|nr:hypothetical protein LMH87_010181 [Akanthomyces muscarius]KAJ4153707.1 hypothetical protein LMH87_010181 [Akanthomyces muscarius]